MSTVSDTPYDSFMKRKLAVAGELFMPGPSTSSVIVAPDDDGDDRGPVLGDDGDADVTVLPGGRKGRQPRRRVEVRRNVRGDALVGEVQQALERALRPDVDDCDQCNQCQHDCIHVGNTVLLYVLPCVCGGHHIRGNMATIRH